MTVIKLPRDRIIITKNQLIHSQNQNASTLGPDDKLMTVIMLSLFSLVSTQSHSAQLA